MDLVNLLNNQKKRYLDANRGAFVLLVAIAVDIIVVQGVIAFLATFFALLFGIDATNFYLNMSLNVCIQISFVAVVLFFLKKHRLVYSPALKDYSKPRIQSTIINSLIGVGGVAVCLLCFYGIATAFDLFLQTIGFSMGAFLEFNGAAEMAVVFFVVVVCAPIGEELLFRGALLSGLKKSGFSDLACVLFTGFAFSLMHMNPAQTVYQFFIGCAFGYITIKSNSLLPAIFMHAANNLFALLLDIAGITFLERMMEWMYSSIWLGLIMSIILAAVGVFAIYGIGYLCGRVIEKFHTKADYELEPEPTLQTPYAIPAFAPAYHPTQQFTFMSQPNPTQQSMNPNIPNPLHQNQTPKSQSFANQPSHSFSNSPSQSFANQPHPNQTNTGQTNTNWPYQNANQPNLAQSAPNQGLPNAYAPNQPNAANQGYSNPNQTYPNQPYPNQAYPATPNFGYPQGYGYTPYYPYPPQSFVRKKPDPKGKSKFSLYYWICIGICASVWMTALFLGVFLT